MEQARNVFQRMIDGVVNASAVANQLNTLAKQVEAMNTDLEFLRMRNRELDEQVIEVRRQRDQALARVEELERSRGHEFGEVEALQREVESSRAECVALRGDLVDAKRDRDDAMYSNLDLKDRYDSAKAMIDKASAIFCQGNPTEYR
jgi:chromosome segregation ATPase